MIVTQTMRVFALGLTDREGFPGGFAVKLAVGS